MSVYYNEFDPFAVRWLRQLIADGILPDGLVDDRPIQEVRPNDLKGFAQCHFFAGIGGWAYALQLAGISPDSGGIWTGSCPCQPFSEAGKQKGGADDRHLWPEWFRLIRESKPAIIFGEQVASAIRHGWLDLVATDLESEGYAVGAAVLGAHSIDAPHLRKRLWFLAHSKSYRNHGRSEEIKSATSRQKRNNLQQFNVSGNLSFPMVDPDRTGLEGHSGDGERRDESGRKPEEKDRQSPAPSWSDPEWVRCLDGKSRPFESGIFPLVDGVSERMVREAAIRTKRSIRTIPEKPIGRESKDMATPSFLDLPPNG